MPTILEQYRIADFLDWSKEKRIRLNPEFQRGSIWSSAARIYLIDSILRQLPIPKIYLRTTIDTKTQQSVREVVDGQQRLRAIFDFADDKISLSKRAGEFAGFRYSSLPPEKQEVFLNYPIAVGQLINAGNTDVLDIFSRLNSYSVVLNPAEKRHAIYQGDFKHAVRTTSKRWSVLWESMRVLTVQQAVRMQDDSLMAEMFGLVLEGLRDGGQPNIDKLYKKYDIDHTDDVADAQNKIDKILEFVTESPIRDVLTDSPIVKAPHFLMISAAVLYLRYGIDSNESDVPNSQLLKQRPLNDIIDRIQNLSSVLDSHEPNDHYKEFWAASRSSTQRISSRRIRFPYYVDAIAA